MISMRSLLAGLLAGAALLAAGCGGGSSSNVSSSSGTVLDTAALAPADAGLWIWIDTDRSSDQWVALDAVLARIPGAEKLVNDALAQAGQGQRQGKLDFRTDIQPAIGTEVVVVLPAGSSDPVVLVKPADESKFKALLSTSKTPPATGERDGWTIVAEKQKAIDTYTAALDRGTLADSDAFAAAMNGLPQVALARAFVDGKGLAAAFGKAAATGSSALGSLPVSGLGSAGSSVSPKAIEQLGTIGLAVSAGDHVLRVDGSFANAGGAKPASFAPTLLGKVPGDALVAATWNGSGAEAAALKSGLGGVDVQRQLGVSQADLAAALDGEGVLYLRPSLLIPEVTLVVEPKDPARAKRVFETLVAKALKGSSGSISIPGLEPTVSALGDLVFVSTAKDASASFGGSAAKLVDSTRFKTAAAGVGLGAKTDGFVFVDVGALGPLLSGILSSAGASSGDSSLEQLTDALSAIDSLAINTSDDGGRVRFQGVVRVR